MHYLEAKDMCRVIQIFERGARILDGSFMTQELSIPSTNSETSSASDNSTVMSVSIADPYVLLRMTDGSILLLVGDPAACTVSINSPTAFECSKKSVSACSLYRDKGPEPWLHKASSDAWLSTGIGESIDSADGGPHDQGDIYCVICYENGALEIFDESSEDSEKLINKSSEELPGQGRKENIQNLKVVELAMQRWPGNHSRPFLFGILTDGTILCYHAFLFEGPENASKIEGSTSGQSSAVLSNASASRLRNLRFIRVSLDAYTREETSNGTLSERITIFKNISGYQGFFLSGLRPAWFMVFRQRLRVHPQICDGSIVAFTVLHNGILKICQMPSTSNYDNYWPVQKIPLRGTPHQVTYFAEWNLYPLIVSVPVHKPVNQVLSSLVDQEDGHQMDNHNLSSDELYHTYTVDEFEVRIMEPEKSGGPWETKATIPMQSSENALTVRVVTLFFREFFYLDSALVQNTTTKENETLLAIGTAYVQGEDVAARGRVLLYSIGRGTDNNQNLVKNFILLGDVHKSIYFLSWKEQGAQLSLLAKDFGSLDCFATEFLIDGSTLSLMVSDEQKNIQIFYYAPKISESWKGQKLLSRAEFHVGAHVTKILRLQMLSTSSRTGAPVGSDKTNRFALLFGTLDGSIGCIAPLEELTFRRLQSLQKKLVDAVPHVAGLNPRSFRHFRSNGKAHRPGPDSVVDCELLCQSFSIALFLVLWSLSMLKLWELYGLHCYAVPLGNASIGGTARNCTPDRNDPFPNPD
ncbi:Cleavage and polyadenylation specificity factor subunit 1 [Hibiscus syriacus]|uniref:Cleavage and polyadenylation specificity factor subunit 1 n=1 Tax=Hibiscus syriacus TaxID=106335 RepID=A0A6A2YQ85_HIBSY|nr:Cleavage and polyadenylation specificity factor subunit 1 [Hibiscus syriacus]